MSPVEILILAASGAAAGMINAVAGGGTLVSFPALLAIGTPAVIANATSTLALVFGTAGSIYGYRRHLSAVMPWLKRFVPVSLLGGLLGGVLLTRTSDALFTRMVPFLLLFATILFTFQGAFRKWLKFSNTPGEVAVSSRVIWGAMLFQFLVSLYGGYFGAGIGILMLATLGYLGLSDIHQMNCVKTVLGSLINQVAAIYFIASGLIDWPKMGVMTIGALAGYFIGSHFAQQIPQKRVRQIITLIGFTITVIIFWRQLYGS